MAEFKRKFPSFGEHIQIQQPPLQVDGDSGTMKLVQKIVVDMKENIENEITEAIIEAAKGQGITDLIVLDKKAIIDALQKRTPKKPEYYGDGYSEGKLVYDYAKCPVCGRNDFEYDINNWGCNYCPDCGQALDWSDNDEN